MTRLFPVLALLALGVACSPLGSVRLPGGNLSGWILLTLLLGTGFYTGAYSWSNARENWKRLRGKR